MTQQPHGTRVRYNKGGCRCDACRAANTAYQRAYLRDRERTIPADMTRDEIVAMLAQHLPISLIASVSGHEITHLARIASGDVRRVHRSTAEDIRATADLLLGVAA